MENKETKLAYKIYSSNVLEEWRRLNKDPFHRLEFDTTMRFLKRYLPKKGLILDAGGGPGRYSIELAKMGYDVLLLDLVPELLEFAKKKIKQAKVQEKIKVVRGTITNLSNFKNNSFDAVLCLGGALSHVHPEKNRKKAISELIRVAKRNAPIFVSVMGKWGALLRWPRSPQKIKNTTHFRNFYLKGDNYQWHQGKGYAHYFEVDELKSLFHDRVEFLENVGLEGLATPLEKEINKMAKKEPKAWKNWLEMHNKLCTNPMIAGFSLHFMVIGKKK